MPIGNGKALDQFHYQQLGYKMSTHKSKRKRAKIHAAKIAALHDDKFLCPETQAAYNQRAALMQPKRRDKKGIKVSYVGSTIADDGFDIARDSLAGIRNKRAKERLSNRPYGSMLPVWNIAKSSHHEYRIGQAIKQINNSLQDMVKNSTTGRTLSDFIRLAESTTNPTWELLQWRVAYYGQRKQWLESAQARLIAHDHMIKAQTMLEKFIK